MGKTLPSKINREKFSEIKYHIYVCKCGNSNNAGSRFCALCGKALVKTCKECNTDVRNDQVYCNYCGAGFKDLLAKKLIVKKITAIAFTSLVIVLLCSLTFIVAKEQQKADEYISSVKLTNFEFPSETVDSKFPIHYELSEKKLHNVKSLNTYITGEGIYTIDNETHFDGKNIDWFVHSNKTGLIHFNVSLYDNEKLLDLRQYSVRIKNNFFS